MKTFLTVVLLAQIWLLGMGVEQIIQGNTAVGVFNVVVNIIFGGMNLVGILRGDA